MHIKILFACILVIFLYMLYPLLVPLILGIILGYMTEPWVEKLSYSKFALKISKNSYYRQYMATGITVLCISLVVIVPFLIAIIYAIRELLSVIEFLTQNFQNININEIPLRVAERLEKLAGDTGIRLSLEKVLEFLNKSLLALFNQLTNILGFVVKGTPEVIFKGFITLLGWIVFAAEGKKIRNVVLPLIIPWPDVQKLLRRITHNVIYSLIIANLSIAVIQALCATIVLALFNVPKWLLWGFLTIFASFIPFIGVGVILVSAGLWLYTNGSPVSGAIVALSTLIIGTVDNIIRPFIMQKGVDIDLFWMFIAIIAGIGTFGVLGAILGPLIFALCIEFGKEIRKTRKLSKVSKSE